RPAAAMARRRTASAWAAASTTSGCSCWTGRRPSPATTPPPATTTASAASVRCPELRKGAKPIAAESLVSAQQAPHRPADPVGVVSGTLGGGLDGTCFLAPLPSTRRHRRQSVRGGRSGPVPRPDEGKHQQHGHGERLDLR